MKINSIQELRKLVQNGDFDLTNQQELGLKKMLPTCISDIIIKYCDFSPANTLNIRTKEELKKFNKNITHFGNMKKKKSGQVL